MIRILHNLESSCRDAGGKLLQKNEAQPIGISAAPLNGRPSTGGGEKDGRSRGQYSPPQFVPRVPGFQWFPIARVPAPRRSCATSPWRPRIREVSRPEHSARSRIGLTTGASASV